MKKFLYVSLIAVLIFSLIGCSEAVDKQEVNTNIERDMANEVQVLSIKDYYPFDENLLMEYEGTGSEYAEQKRYVEYIEENKIQIRIENPGTTLVKVLEYKNGMLKEVFGEGEFYHIENMLNANRNLDNIILKEPLEIGNSWTNSDGNTKEITSLDKEIDTPYGKYKALEVTTKYESGAIEKNYYGKDIGFLGSIYEDEVMEIKTLLKSRENQGQKINIEAYYPTASNVNTKYIVEEVDFSTNDRIENILENIFKNPPSEELLPSISEETNVNEIKLDRNSWTLKVDFSSELLEDMNAGSSFEIEILKSIVNTLGRFYDVDKVYITVKGEPYESGHFSIKEGEYFEVNTKDIEELK